MLRWNTVFLCIYLRSFLRYARGEVLIYSFLVE